MRTFGRLSVPAVGIFLLAVAALAVAGVALPAVQAAGGEIRVVEARQQVNYPAGVALSVTIESDAEIDEVRVYYRPAGLRQWGYAYANFDPGKRIIATQSIPVREATYIAPGADVEYYYEIRDAEGNLLRTDPSVVEYLDQRFNWQRVDIGPLELVYHDIGDSKVEKTATVLREDLRRVEELLQLDKPKGFKGVIYNSHADATAAFPVQSQTTTDHGTFAGYAFAEQGVFVGTGLDRRVIVHESAHLLLREALGNRSVEMPAWLNEGFASYMEPNVRVRSSAELYNRTPHLKAMRQLSGTPATIPLFYHKSVSVVAHLIEKYGEEEFRLLIEEISKGGETNAALLKIYGFDNHGLDNSWAGLPIPDLVLPGPSPSDSAGGDPASDQLSGVRQTGVDAAGQEQVNVPSQSQTGSSGNAEQSSQQGAQSASDARGENPSQPQQQPQRDAPSPFIFFDAWILAGVAILAVAVLSARYIYRWLRPQNDADGDGWES